MRIGTLNTDSGKFVALDDPDGSLKDIEENLLLLFGSDCPAPSRDQVQNVLLEHFWKLPFRDILGKRINEDHDEYGLLVAQIASDANCVMIECEECLVSGNDFRLRLLLQLDTEELLFGSESVKTRRSSRANPITLVSSYHAPQSFDAFTREFGIDETFPGYDILQFWSASPFADACDLCFYCFTRSRDFCATSKYQQLHVKGGIRALSRLPCIFDAANRAEKRFVCLVQGDSSPLVVCYVKEMLCDPNAQQGILHLVDCAPIAAEYHVTHLSLKAADRPPRPIPELIQFIRRP